MYGYGYRYNSGLVLGAGGGAPFANTKSLLFDGVDDYVELGTQSLGLTAAISVSAWVKIPISGGWGAPYVEGICVENGISGNNWNLLFRPLPFFNYFAFTIYHTNGTSTTLTSSGVTPNDGQWHHLLATSDGTTNANGVKLYVDGVLNVQATAASTGTKSTPTVIPTIGSTSNNSWYFEGNIDEVSIFDTDQSANVATLSTAPTVDLTSLNPIAWYRNGDNGSWKSPQWLIPNNENKDNASNYSFELDGIDDKITLGSSVDLGINSTISVWLNLNSGYNGILLGEDSYDFNYILYPYSSGFYVFIGSIYKLYANVHTYLTAGSWHHLAVVRSGDSVECFVDGISRETQTGFGTSITTKFDTIGAKPVGTVPLGGKIGEIAAWDNNTVNITDIYNGGTPTTLPSGAVAHYKMGEEATFSGGVWTVPDEAGANDGTSSGMLIDSRVGDAPNSTSNALSLNMDEVDRVTDVPT